MLSCVFIFIYTTWDLFGFLNMWIAIVYQFWKIINHFLLKYFSDPFSLFHLFTGTGNIKYIIGYLTLHSIALNLCNMSSILVSLHVAMWIISFDLSSNSINSHFNMSNANVNDFLGC